MLVRRLLLSVVEKIPCVSGRHSVPFGFDFPRGFSDAFKHPKKLPKKTRREKLIDLADAGILPTIAIIGRPNVGKSALFNRFAKSSQAMVYNTPEGHVTRDYREGLGSLGDLHFRMFDTSGLEPFMTEDTILARATRLTEDVLKQSDIALLLLDSRAGILPGDQDLGAWLRSHTRAPVVLVANKAESRGNNTSVPSVGEVLADATRLGFGEAVPISAETGEGLVDFIYCTAALSGPFPATQETHGGTAGTGRADGSSTDALGGQEVVLEVEGQEAPPQETDPGPIKIAIVGEPNVGKSTLANKLLGRERSLTGPEAGLTRDTVEAGFSWNARAFRLLDTAGWMKPSKLPPDAPGQAVMGEAMTQAERGWNLAHVALDQHGALSGGKVVREGRALLILVNKLDTLDPSSSSSVVQLVEEALSKQLPEVVGATCLGVSALTGSGTETIMPAIVRAYDTWTMRIPTARLNRWLLLLVEQYHGTQQGREVLRIRYVTQVSTRPPAFVAFTSGRGAVPSGFQRFLLNKLRDYFGFPGVPMRLTLRSRKRAEREKSASSVIPRKSQKVGVWMARKPPRRKKKLPKKDPFAWLR
eukprot:jgi/Botrbrau1/19407/Bobra.0338s0034.1